MESELFQMLSENVVIGAFVVLASCVAVLFRFVMSLQKEFREYIKNEGIKTAELLARATAALERIEKTLEKK